MEASNFDAATLKGEKTHYQEAVDDLAARYHFDFASLGLTAFLGSPLKWIYSAGATGNRHRRIVLAPGHGVGGIVLKTGKPMVLSNIDEELDPREYSSYPIVFAEDLRSFCALPVARAGRLVGVLLCAFRTERPDVTQIYHSLIDHLDGRFCDLDIVNGEFLDFAWAYDRDDSNNPHAIVVRSELSRAIDAQETERRRISRELHDGIAQELVTASFILRRAAGHVDTKGCALINEALEILNSTLDEIHNISVVLRPSTLDNLGFVAALRSQATVLEKTYGCEVIITGELFHERFDHAMETQLYRICQEAITNACKYSGADYVEVLVEEAGDWLHVSVIDKGCGFDIHSPKIRGSGCGLLGMRERADIIGAILDIKSNNAGTQVTITAPMYLEEEKTK